MGYEVSQHEEAAGHDAIWSAVNEAVGKIIQENPNVSVGEVKKKIMNEVEQFFDDIEMRRSMNALLLEASQNRKSQDEDVSNVG